MGLQSGAARMFQSLGRVVARLKSKHRWGVALVVAMGAYVGHVTLAFQRSLAELQIAGATFAIRATTVKLPVGQPGGEGAPAPRRVDAESLGLRDADSVGRYSIPRAAGAPDPSGPSTADATVDDPNVLRQGALIEIAARPEFAELLDSRGAEVRKAVLDFFEHE